ncbi:MAG TPA: tyrosine--tRNA ligase [Methanomassiliicoccales archaeon]|nr:tyrosine--tRNA ligase [Methanomassiliicoccales archaeon]
MISMDSEERFDLLTRNAEEVVTHEELKKLLETNDRPKGYVGFEPSGLVHLGWVIISNKVRDFVDAGFDFTVFFADWHAYINDKLGGNIDTIRICARYMEDCFEALGVPRDKVNFIYAFELMDNIDYWSKVISIGKNSTLSRVKRAMTIMGREGDEAEVDTSKVMYPLMQAADIFALDVDVAYAGIDQRRAHMLAREAADKLGWKKPVALHTPLLSSLKGGDRMDPLAAKMSKSDPDSGIMIHDSPEDIRRKIKKAFCPPEAEGNPILDICRFIIFQRMDVLKIDRPEKFGGTLVFESYPALEESYVAGQLHPMDLKNGTASALVEMLAPVREFFEKHPENLDRIREIINK